MFDDVIRKRSSPSARGSPSNLKRSQWIEVIVLDLLQSGGFCVFLQLSSPWTELVARSIRLVAVLVAIQLGWCVGKGSWSADSIPKFALFRTSHDATNPGHARFPNQPKSIQDDASVEKDVRVVIRTVERADWASQTEGRGVAEAVGLRKLETSGNPPRVKTACQNGRRERDEWNTSAKPPRRLPGSKISAFLPGFQTSQHPQDPPSCASKLCSLFTKTRTLPGTREVQWPLSGWQSLVAEEFPHSDKLRVCWAEHKDIEAPLKPLAVLNTTEAYRAAPLHHLDTP